MDTIVRSVTNAGRFGRSADLSSPAYTAEPAETEQQRRKRSAAIAETRREIDREGGIPIEEIEAWVDSWDTPNEPPLPEPRK